MPYIIVVRFVLCLFWSSSSDCYKFEIQVFILGHIKDNNWLRLCKWRTVLEAPNPGTLLSFLGFFAKESSQPLYWCFNSSIVALVRMLLLNTAASYLNGTTSSFNVATSSIVASQSIGKGCNLVFSLLSVRIVILVSRKQILRMQDVDK